MQELGYMKTLPQEAGFDYSNCLRNKALLNNVGMGLKTNVQNMKTGTTICGLIYKVSDFVELTKKLDRTVLLSLPTLVPLVALSLETRTVRRSTT